MSERVHNEHDAADRILQSHESDPEDEQKSTPVKYIKTINDHKGLNARGLEKSTSRFKPEVNEDNDKDDSAENNSLKMLTKEDAKSYKGNNKVSPEVEHESEDLKNPLKKKITYLNVTTTELWDMNLGS